MLAVAPVEYNILGLQSHYRFTVVTLEHNNSDFTLGPFCDFYGPLLNLVKLVALAKVVSPSVTAITKLRSN